MNVTFMAAAAAVGIALSSTAAESGLIGHWKLQGDAKDYSGKGNHGKSHGANAAKGEFDGVSSYVEIPSSPALRLGSKDFSIAAWVYTEKDLADVFGDIIDLYDPAQRKGVTLSLNSTGNGYAGPGNDCHVSFGIDNARTSDWTDCGRPNPNSRYISNSMLTYKGKLYVAATDGKDEADWGHVYRYEGGQKWADCGRVGNFRTTGIGPLFVHNGELHAVTSTYDWTRVSSGNYDPGRMFRYAGGTNWIDCGQVSSNRTMNTAASYKGRIFAGGGPENWSVHEYLGDKTWRLSTSFSKEGEQRCFPHPMGRFNGRLYTGWPAVHSFDGTQWSYAGLPGPLGNVPSLQVHSLVVYGGSLYAGTWPEAVASKYLGGESWQPCGRVGEDGTEVNALTVYNGKLYGGSIPRAEVARYEGDTRWTSLKRFHTATNNWVPGLPGKANRRQVNEWGRITTLTVHDGKLFAGLGNCTSAARDTVADPNDVLGKVFFMEAGKCASYDSDAGPGWKHIAAVRDGGLLKIFVNGKLAAKSSRFNSKDYDISVDQPLRIGLGQVDYFSGKISDVRLYNKAIAESRIRKLASAHPK